jgi:negative regulator of replication initiation
VVPLPRRENTKSIGESLSLVVRRFLSLKRSLHARGQFGEFSEVMKEYFDLGHAEPVPPGDWNKTTPEVCYLPVHAESSTTTEVRAVFDASM